MYKCVRFYLICMADEAEIITLLGNQGDPVEYTVTAGTAIPKGTLMHISASNTAAIAGNDGEFFAGIAASEKTATDGVTKMACLTHCVALLTAGVGATTFGQPQKLSGTNASRPKENCTVFERSQ